MYAHMYIPGMVLFLHLGNKGDNKEETETKPSKLSSGEGKSPKHQADVIARTKACRGRCLPALQGSANSPGTLVKLVKREEGT